MASCDVYVTSALTRRIRLSMQQLDCYEAREAILEVLVKDLEGRCVQEGFVKPGSVVLLNLSSPKLVEQFAEFFVEFRADIALPAEGQVISCIVENNSHAGLTCTMKASATDISPFLINVFRNHHHTSARLAKYTPGTTATVEVTGSRYEVNDPYITIFASLRDGITETADLDAPVWTAEIMHTVSAHDVQSSPKKTFVIDNSKASKEVRAMPNVVELNTKDFTTAESNVTIIDQFIHELQSTKAKTIVFPRDFGESIRPKDPDSYRYLVDKLRLVGFHAQPQQDADDADSNSEEESDDADY
jgi:hypothetical protein